MYIKKAYDKKKEKPVILKVFRKESLTVDKLRSAKLEKKLMELLDHPNIMRLQDTCESRDFFVLVMDQMVDDLRNIMMIGK